MFRLGTRKLSRTWLLKIYGSEIQENESDSGH